MIRSLIGAVACWLAASGAALAQGGERILDFASDIRIAADGALTVTERIKVVALGREIKRGIYRDFPTRYPGAGGGTVSVGFSVERVTRNGREIDYFTEDLGNGVRVYMGSRDKYIDAGTYDFALSYRTEGQIGFFEEWDELYWNVNGTDWIFPIENLSATVTLPEGADIKDYTANTGRQGAHGIDYEAVQQGATRIRFAATRPLAPRENMSIVVSWPKGIVAEPGLADHIARYGAANRPLWVALIGFLAALLYYLVAWNRVGRDPAAGTIIPHFEPPDGFSPAALRFIKRMGFDNKVLAAAVISMAVKGYLTIEEDDDEDYRLVRTDASEEALSRGERRLAKHLFGSHESIFLIPVNHARIGAAQMALRKSLKNDYAALHFRRNWGWLAGGIAISVLTIIAVAFMAGSEVAAFMSLWLAGWTAGCALLLGRVVSAWRGGPWGPRLGNTLFAIPFVIGWFVGAGIYASEIGVPAAFTIVAILVMNGLFYEWIKAPTAEGRALLDRIEGFQLYLTVAEKDRLGILHPPDMTPALFEAYLPYALALDVEHEWSRQFDGVLAAAGAGPAQYSPAWYHGRHWSAGNFGGFGSGLGGALSGAIASSASAPGSSSGFGGGGGGSGGGGGGGGGGGF